MDILIESLIDLHTTTLVRLKCLISVLEEKGIVTRDQIESIHANLSQDEMNDAAKKVKDLFGDYVRDRIVSRP